MPRADNINLKILQLRTAGAAAALEAGKYWVRSTAHTLEDGSGILPP
jgi:hypothetical protein